MCETNAFRDVSHICKTTKTSSSNMLQEVELTLDTTYCHKIMHNVV